MQDKKFGDKWVGSDISWCSPCIVVMESMSILSADLMSFFYLLHRASMFIGRRGAKGGRGAVIMVSIRGVNVGQNKYYTITFFSQEN